MHEAKREDDVDNHDGDDDHDNDNDHHHHDIDDDDVAGVSQKERYMGQVKGAIRAKRWLKVMMTLSMMMMIIMMVTLAGLIKMQSQLGT